MFTGDGTRAAIRDALQAGVAAYVVGDVPAARIESLLTVAIERFAVESPGAGAARSQASAGGQAMGGKSQGHPDADPLNFRGQAHRLLRERAMQARSAWARWRAKSLSSVNGWAG